MASILARCRLNNSLRFINLSACTTSGPLQIFSNRDFQPLNQLQITTVRQQYNYAVLKKSSQNQRIAINDCNYGTKSDKIGDQIVEDEDKKPLSLFQRFKQMYRDYWYVLVPVHLVTSAGWMAAFYYVSKSGIDVVGIMESYNISERITNPLKDSSLGYLAIAYAMYKIATPIRYTVTLGGTTVSINYLKKWGYIKPVPTREQLREIYKEKKDNIMYSMKDKRDELRLKKEQLKDRTDDLLDDMETKIITKINDSKKKRARTTNAIKSMEKP